MQDTCASEGTRAPDGIVDRLTALDPRPGVALLRCIEPALAEAVRGFRSRVTPVIGTPPLPVDPVDTALLAGWSPDLLRIVGQALVLELNIARVEGDLAGATPEARYQCFVDKLAQPRHARELLARYRLMVRQVGTAIANRVEARAELVERLQQDWPRICATLGFEPHDELTGVDAETGDAHRGGRSVAVLTFASGKRLVYKPRPIGVEQSFQGLLSWLNARGAPRFRTTVSVAGDGYGWVEFVAAEGCASRHELGRFYRRQGAFVALLYALGATDFHFENVIAAGEHPVLVDLETLFHPRAFQTASETAHGDALLSAALLDSVMRIGLLPLKLWFAGGNLDISGLGGSSGQLSPERLPYWTAVDTDEMRLEWRRVPLKQGNHRPTYRGAVVDPTLFTSDVEAGFGEMYALLRREREALLSDDSPLVDFTRHELRVLLRPTWLYADLLYQALHPDVQGRPTARDRFAEVLRDHAGDRPHLRRIIQAELRELDDGDIPIFTTRVGSLDVVSGAGDVIRNVFDNDGVSNIGRRLRGFSDRDFARQNWLVRAALAAAVAEHRPGPSKRSPSSARRPRTDPTSHPRRLLRVAKAIADRLEELAIPAGGALGWIGLSPVGEREWTLAPSALDLYNGLPGIALFFGQLAAVTAEPRYQELCRTANDAVAMWLDIPDLMTGLGAYTGWSGFSYYLLRVGTLLGEPALVDEAFARAAALRSEVERDRHFDLLYGTAGYLAVLCALHRTRPDPAIAAAARTCGDHLVANAVDVRGGVGWIPHDFADEPLGGLSHGAAGIAWALLQLHDLEPDPRYLETARRAVAFERALWCPQTGDWLDLRKRTGEDAPKIVAWCNGAPGIGLARVRSRRYWDDPSITQDIERAVESTVTHGFAMNHSLCHGALGNVELLLEASRSAPSQRRLAEQLSDAVEEVLLAIEQQGPACGVPLAVESPGLMTGLAGIGYQCLRLADPDRVPSVLLLDEPTR